MGLTYKTFQSLSYFGLEWGREKGIKVDKQHQRERTNKLYQEARDMMNNDALDTHWNNLLQESWDWNQESVTIPTKKKR
jgi:hypothetical protein